MTKYRRNDPKRPITFPDDKLTKLTRRRPPRRAEQIDRKARALAGFRASGTVQGACKKAGVSRQTWYNWTAADEQFAEAQLAATQDVVDELEAEAIKRAKKGSDALLMFLLKARRPAVFREKQVIELVSPEVRESLRQTIAVINESLPQADAEALLEKLDQVWGAKA